MQTQRTKKRDAFVDKLLGKLTLEEKVGQCFTLSWRGSLVTPSVMDLIDKLQVGGFRIEPYTTESATAVYYGRRLNDPHFHPPKDYRIPAQTYFRARHPGAYAPPEHYARRLNQLKELAMARPSGLPLHITLDYEGDFSHDYAFGGMHMFPAPMGFAAAGDPELLYRAARAVARQLRAVGITMIHSPVCDVNVNPDNPEIGTRSFSDDPKVCADMCLAQFRGLRDGGLVAIAKHYPGRGDSATDAHDELPTIAAAGDVLRSRDLVPYRALIAAGLGGVMTAHTRYPGLDKRDLPATLSAPILIDVLRTELGFGGVITTDAMGMGAIVNRWGIPRASVMALQAGCNLVLIKNDEEVRAQSFYEVRRAVQEGELPEAKLDDSLRYVLNMKYDQGLFQDGGVVDPARAPVVVGQARMRATAVEAAEKSLMVLRDEQRLLPLSVARKVLVIEQIVPEEFTPNDVYCNSHVLNEAMVEQSRAVINATTEFQASEREVALLLEVAAEADVVVMTNFYWRIRPQNNAHLARALIEAGRKVVVVTNTPYAVGNIPQARTVVCTFGAAPQSLRAAARFLYGKLPAPGRWPLKHYQP